MLLDAIFFIALCIILVIQALFTFVPLGNENSTVRRLPYVTFTIMAICVIAYYVTLPSTVQQERQLMEAGTKLEEFLLKNQRILVDEGVQRKLKDAGIMSQQEIDAIKLEIEASGAEADIKSWLRGAEALKLREELDKIIVSFKAAVESSLWYRYGLAPNGKWKAHQLITAMFLHGSTLHLFGNLIFFFAVGFSLEDLWGRGTFLAFYIMAGIAACLPDLIHPNTLPMIGASGAISGTMGAFLVRLHSTRVKIGWISLPLGLLFMIVGKKPYGVINLRAYIFLPFYFICQVLPWWFFSKAGLVSGVAYSAHVAGFLFGVMFAFFMKATRAEETYINPKIEAKVSFAASPAVTQSLDLFDRGEVAMAERKLKAHISKQPGDLNAILALIQVYEKTLDFDRLNAMYGRLIRYHLDNEDKEAALYAYDNLLSAFPDDNIKVRIPVRDWVSLCEYLVESEMKREAGVEYERLVNAYIEDPAAVRACVQGGEIALAAFDNERAFRMFEMAMTMNPPAQFISRIESGMEKCRTRLSQRPDWVKEPPKPRAPSRLA